jgi:sorbitol/mannitol transport system substrate-binding protein
MSIKKTLLTTALSFGLTAGIAAADGHAPESTRIVNNGHMINMQSVAEAYTEETGVVLNWVSLEEGVLREQVTSDTATGGGQYDIINIGMQEAPRCRMDRTTELRRPHDVDDLPPAMRDGLSADGTLCRTVLR